MNGAAAGRARTALPLVILLALAIFLHALDRGNFSTAAPLIKEDLGFSNTQIGLLLSVFFWAYVPAHLLAGWLIERIGAVLTLTLGVALWGAATLAMGLAGGFVSILILRLLLGLGESAGFPAVSKLLASNLPNERLAAANGLVGAGLMLGNGAGVLASGLVAAAFGWKVMFVLFGAVSLLWLVPWGWLALRGGTSVQEEQTQVVEPAPSYRELLSRREMWAAMLGMFSANYPYFLVLSWLPLFLVKEHGFSMAEMAWIGAAVFVIAGVVNVVAGRVADYAIARGADITRTRKLAVVGGLAIGVGCMALCALGGPRLAVMGLLLFSFSPGLMVFSTMSIGQTLAGPRAAGKWIGLQNGVGGISGVVGPLLTGILLDATGDYRIAFLFAAAVTACGMAFWGLMIRRVEPIKWSSAP